MSPPPEATAEPERASERSLPRRLLGKLPLFLLLGAALTVAVAWACALLVDPLEGTQTQAQGSTNDDRWATAIWQRTGAFYSVMGWQRGFNWSPSQITGPPDSPMGGDSVTAWASMNADAAEWLVIDYAKAVVPSAIDVYETDNPGAVTRVTVFDEFGREIEAWKGQDPMRPGMPAGISKIPLKTNVRTSRVKIYLDSAAVPGWNEVDAAGLVDEKGAMQWASSVQASSWWGSGGGPGVGPQGVLPPWSGPTKPSNLYEGGTQKSDERIVDARGWPMLAMWSEHRTPGSSPATMQMASGTVIKPQPRLPWRPIWGGFAVNTTIYAAVCAGFYIVVVLPRRILRELSRLREGRCIQCGYDIGYDFRSGCPDCGWRRSGGTPP